jgi:uncharacterized protein YjbI with pentapeptide repeats
MRDRWSRENLAKYLLYELGVWAVVLALGLGFLFLTRWINQACPFKNPDQCTTLSCLSTCGALLFLPLGLYHVVMFGWENLHHLLILLPRDAPRSADIEDAEELLARYEAGDRDFGRVALVAGADLEGANLSYAILRLANLSGVDFRGASLHGANLQGADLSSANLRGASLRQADLSGTNLHGASLEGADLEGANLEGANLSFADLHRANLTVSDLRQALLRNANLRDARLHFADLRDADLDEANLIGAQISFNELALAGSLRRTTMPDGRIHT